MTSIEKLIQSADENSEIIHAIDQFRFRIDLKPDDLRLWSETLRSRKERCNLLLACEHGDGAIEHTALTWVVGAAIRPFYVQSPEDVGPLLASLGVNNALASKLPNFCPGLGTELTWAFYLDRSGALSASPVPRNS